MSQVIEVDDSNFESEVVKETRPVLVDFSATWCGPCKKIEPVVKEIAGDYEGRLKVVKVDVDRAPNTAAKFAVLSVPTLLFFRDGTVRDQITGVVPKRQIAERVDKVL
jgi:thioredoxin 1